MQIMPRILVVLLLFSLSPYAAAGAGMLDRIRTSQNLTIAYAPNAFPISFKGARKIDTGSKLPFSDAVVVGKVTLPMVAGKIVW